MAEGPSIGVSARAGTVREVTIWTTSASINLDTNLTGGETLGEEAVVEVEASVGEEVTTEGEEEGQEGRLFKPLSRPRGVEEEVDKEEEALEGVEG